MNVAILSLWASVAMAQPVSMVESDKSKGKACYDGTCAGCIDDCSAKLSTTACYGCCSSNGCTGSPLTWCQDYCDGIAAQRAGEYSEYTYDEAAQLMASWQWLGPQEAAALNYWFFKNDGDDESIGLNRQALVYGTGLIHTDLPEGVDEMIRANLEYAFTDDRSFKLRLSAVIMTAEMGLAADPAWEALILERFLTDPAPIVRERAGIVLGLIAPEVDA